jgi:mono/diheme cytochrome c family protein
MWRTNLRVLCLALAVIGFYTMVAHIIPQLQSEVPETLALGGDVTPEALVAAGEKVFNGAGGCTTCHGLGTRAPNLLTDEKGQGSIGARCGRRKPGMDCKAYLYESLVKPGAFVVPGYEPIMPEMRRQLSEDQIWAVVAFLESQGGEVTVTGADVKSTSTPGTARPPAAGAPAAPPATTDPHVLYRQMGCIGCHQLEGGGGQVGPSFDHIGRRLRPDQIRRAILFPNADTAKGFEKVAGVMPTNFGQQLSAAQLEALVEFLGSRK